MPEVLELLIPIVAILFGSIIVLIPIAGLTLRFALKPAMEAYAKVREVNAPDLRQLEQRIAAVEAQLREGTRARVAEPPAAGLIAEPTHGPT